MGWRAISALPDHSGACGFLPLVQTCKCCPRPFACVTSPQFLFEDERPSVLSGKGLPPLLTMCQTSLNGSQFWRPLYPPRPGPRFGPRPDLPLTKFHKSSLHWPVPLCPKPNGQWWGARGQGEHAGQVRLQQRDRSRRPSHAVSPASLQEETGRVVQRPLVKSR